LIGGLLGAWSVPNDLVDGGLFEVDPAERVDLHSLPPKPLVNKTFGLFDPNQGLLLAPSLDEWLPTEHLARLVAELVDEHLELSRIHSAYTEGRAAL
jgi:hypothetical protein